MREEDEDEERSEGFNWLIHACTCSLATGAAAGGLLKLQCVCVRVHQFLNPSHSHPSSPSHPHACLLQNSP